MSYRLRILHISDLHIRGDRETERWRRRRVLGEAWEKNLDVLLEEGPVDLVTFTGDLAFSGQPDEYEGATGFLHATLERLKLGQDRLFVVPGNHDVDRGRSADAWSELRRLLRPEDALEFSRWMASVGDHAPRGFRASLRDEVLERQEAYRRWLRETLGRPELLPDTRRHPRLGYRSTLRLPGHPFEVHMVGLDSSWLAGSDDDAGRLWLTEDQVMRLAADERGGKLPGFRVALIHHPLGDLADGSQARRMLAEHVDLLLRGHLHEPEVGHSEDPAGALRSLAAGSLYENDQYPNSCQLIQVTLDDGGRPRGFEVRFRSWSRRGHWYDDDSLYPGSRGGRIRWNGAAFVEGATPPHPGVGRLFVGREEPLRRLKEALLPSTGLPRAVSLQGMPGVGKSYLVDRFATVNADQFTGGYVRLVIEPEQHLHSNALLQALAERLELQPGPGGLAATLRGRLRMPATLLSIDNVDTPALAMSAAEVARQLSGCAVLVTGRVQDLGVDAGWAMVKLRPFNEGSAMEQLAKEHRQPRNEAEGEEHRLLVRELGQLPLAIHLAAGYLRKGHTVNGFLAHLRRKKLELGPGDLADPLHAEGASRAILRRSFEVSLSSLSELWRAEWGEDARRFIEGLAALGFAPASGVGRSLGARLAGLSVDDFGHLVAQAVELSVVEKVPEVDRPGLDIWRIHPLLAELLRETADRETVLGRMTGWFVERLPGLREPGREVEQGAWWKEIRDEQPALVAWLPQLPSGKLAEVIEAGAFYAQDNGPFSAWIALCERVLAEGPEPEVRSSVLTLLVDYAKRSGDLETTLSMAKEKLVFERGRQNESQAALASFVIADLQKARGNFDEALRIWLEDVLPVLMRLGDGRSVAGVVGKAAEVLLLRGDLDEAMHLLRDGALPIYERLGDVRARVTILERLVDVLHHRMKLDEALRLLREEILPVYERQGDERSRARALGKLAFVLRLRGEHDEALRIMREEELPVHERLGDMRSRAINLAQIADVIQSRGQFAESLRLLHEEVIPFFERSGEIRDRALAFGTIARIHEARGELDEALRIWREEELPVYERVGDAISRADTLGRIAEALWRRGELDEAIRIRREEQLPVYARRKLHRKLAVVLVNLGGLYGQRGLIEEGRRVLSKETLLGFEGLGLEDLKEVWKYIGQLTKLEPSKKES